MKNKKQSTYDQYVASLSKEQKDTFNRGYQELFLSDLLQALMKEYELNREVFLELILLIFLILESNKKHEDLFLNYYDAKLLEPHWQKYIYLYKKVIYF